MALFRKQRASATSAPGWTVHDPPKQIWDASLNHLASAIEAFNSGPSVVPYETLIAELISAQTGFGLLASTNYRAAHARALESACDDMAKGLTFGDKERTMRGYDGAMTLEQQLAAEYGITPSGSEP